MDAYALQEVLIPLVAIVLGSMIFLIPIAGLTARFALKPIMEAVTKLRGMQGPAPEAGRDVALLEQRVALLEQQLAGMESTLERIEATQSFDRQLRSGS